MFGGERVEIRASSSKPKGSVGQIVWLTEAAPWRWAVAEKSDLKKGLFRKEHLGAESVDWLSARSWD